jgi:hypothetical protein
MDATVAAAALERAAAELQVGSFVGGAQSG